MPGGASQADSSCHGDARSTDDVAKDTPKKKTKEARKGAAFALKEDALVDALNKTMARITSAKVTCLKSTTGRAGDELNKRSGKDTDALYDTEALKKDIDDLMNKRART